MRPRYNNRDEPHDETLEDVLSQGDGTYAMAWAMYEGIPSVELCLMLANPIERAEGLLVREIPTYQTPFTREEPIRVGTWITNLE